METKYVIRIGGLLATIVVFSTISFFRNGSDPYLNSDKITANNKNIPPYVSIFKNVGDFFNAELHGRSQYQMNNHLAAKTTISTTATSLNAAATPETTSITVAPTSSTTTTTINAAATPATTSVTAASTVDATVAPTTATSLNAVATLAEPTISTTPISISSAATPATTSVTAASTVDATAAPTTATSLNAVATLSEPTISTTPISISSAATPATTSVTTAPTAAPTAAPTVATTTVSTTATSLNVAATPAEPTISTTPTSLSSAATPATTSVTAAPTVATTTVSTNDTITIPIDSVKTNTESNDPKDIVPGLMNDKVAWSVKIGPFRDVIYVHELTRYLSSNGFKVLVKADISESGNDLVILLNPATNRSIAEQTIANLNSKYHISAVLIEYKS